MKKYLFIFLIGILPSSCENNGNLKLLAELPKKLEEVSGTETTPNSDLIWMLNDSGNKSEIYGINTKGKIKKTIKIDAKNHDWEDLASDNQGNLYIGDFGNNESKRKNLAILKVNTSDLKSDKKVNIERISFKYPDQKKFPAKKKDRYFDSESFFWHNNYLYIFTKSRVKNNFGKTSLYRVPAKQGQHIAELLGSYEFCSDMSCWVTSADISNDGKKVALLTPEKVWVFSNFINDNFLSVQPQDFPFEHVSQKEGLCFKNNNTLYITDEKAHGAGGNLYEFSIAN